MSEKVKCREALDLLQDYLKEELTPERATLVRAHIEHCRPCLALACFEERFLAIVSESAGRQRCPDKLKARIVALIRGQSTEL